MTRIAAGRGNVATGTRRGTVLAATLSAAIASFAPFPASLETPARADEIDDQIAAHASKAVALAPRAFAARLNDGSVLHVELADEVVEIATRYGTLRVPADEVQLIELGVRVTPELRAQIDRAVAELGHSDAIARADAARQLLTWGPAARAALEKMVGPTAPGWRAARLLAQIDASGDARRPGKPEDDVVYTADSTIVGRLTAPALRVHTASFGEQPLRVADVRSLRSAAYVEPTPEPEMPDVLPDPGTLSAYNNQPGTVLRFRVTGAVAGTIWGSGPYTTDSPLATTAVHAGVMKVGQTRDVRVRIVPSPPSYAGSVQNGVASHDYGQYTMAYEIVREKKRK